ncbi:MAG: SpoVG family protein [Planctomycetota bacterium]
MRITEVRVKLSTNPDDKLLAYCSITFDDAFVVRDLKLIDGGRGRFVAMPSRKLTDHCPVCHAKNQLRAKFCSECGAQLAADRTVRADDGRVRLYADIAHPINAGCRDAVQRAVEEAYDREVELAAEPGYVCTYDDFQEDRYAKLAETGVVEETGASRPVALPGDAEAGKTRRVDTPGKKSLGRPTSRPQRPATKLREDDRFGDGLF